MTTGQLLSSGNQGYGLRSVFFVALPILVMLIATPFTKAGGTQVWFAQALAKGFGVASATLVVLFVVFLIVRPQGWRRKQAVTLAETITLWLAAGITVAHTI